MTESSTAAESKRNIETAYLLSPMQQGMLFHSLYAPESGVYVEQLTAELVGSLDVAAFRHAWQQVVDRHPILRSAFAWKRQERPIQAVYKELALPIDALDWRDATAEEQERRLAERVAAERTQAFDLAKPPLMRLALIRTGEEQHRLVWSHHHILIDGWSMPILLKEVFTLYEAFRGAGQVHCLSPARIATTSHGCKTRIWPRPRHIGAGRSPGSPALFAISVAPAAAAPASGTAELERSLTVEETQRLTALARGAGVTISTVMQGAWAILLSRYSGEEDVVFGLTVSGRPDTLPGAATDDRPVHQHAAGPRPRPIRRRSDALAARTPGAISRDAAVRTHTSR